MSNKIIVPFDDQEGGTYELNIDLDRLSKGEVLNAIVGIGRTKEQSTFISKINKAKKPEEIAPFPGREVRENKINYGKGFDYVYGTKPVSDQEDKNPFASALKKIKPSAEKLSWFKSAVVRAKSPNELHKVVDEALAAGARLNACNDGEWRYQLCLKFFICVILQLHMGNKTPFCCIRIEFISNSYYLKPMNMCF